MGNLNAKIGNENAGLVKVMGKHGCGKTNENGERLVDFCLDFVIEVTLFRHKHIHKLTWKSPYAKTVNQIDHLMINYWRSLLDVRVLRSCLRTSTCTVLTGNVENRWKTIRYGLCKAAEATLKYQERMDHRGGLGKGGGKKQNPS